MVNDLLLKCVTLITDALSYQNLKGKSIWYSIVCVLYGMCMVWYVYGMVFVWYVYGICMVWYVYGICMVWYLYGMVFVWYGMWKGRVPPC